MCKCMQCIVYSTHTYTTAWFVHTFIQTHIHASRYTAVGLCIHTLELVYAHTHTHTHTHTHRPLHHPITTSTNVTVITTTVTYSPTTSKTNPPPQTTTTILTITNGRRWSSILPAPVNHSLPVKLDEPVSEI